MLVHCLSCGIDTTCVRKTRQITSLGGLLLSGSYLGQASPAPRLYVWIVFECLQSAFFTNILQSLTINKQESSCLGFPSPHMQTHKHTICLIDIICSIMSDPNYKLSPMKNWGSAKMTSLHKNVLSLRETPSGSHKDESTAHTLTDLQSGQRSICQTYVLIKDVMSSQR